MRIAGLNVGKVKASARARRTASRRRDRDRAAATRRSRRTPGDPAQQGAAGRDLRRADAGRPVGGPTLEDGEHAARHGRSQEAVRDRRDHLAVRQADAARTSRAGSASWRRRSTRAAGRTSTTRSATCRGSWPPATTCWRCSTTRSRRCGAGAQLRPRRSSAVNERARPAARADRQRQRLLRRAGLAQRVAGRDDVHLPDLPGRVAGHAAPAEDASRATPGRWCATCSRWRTTCSPRCATWAGWRPTSRRCSATSTR